MTTPTTVDDFDTADGTLIFWHPVDDEPITETFLPWGDVAPGSSADQRLRVRNASDDYTATAVIVAVGDPADPTATSAAGQHLVCADGNVFASAVDIGDLAPGATSDPIVLRRITAPDSAPGPAGFTLTATATSWQPAAADVDAATAAGDVYDPDAAAAPVEDPEEQM